MKGSIQYLGADEETRRLAEYEEMTRRDEADWMEGARREGLEKGREEGRPEEKLEVARNTLLRKRPRADIVGLTGLSPEDVKKLEADLSL